VDDDRDRRSEGRAEAHPTEELDVVALEAHPRAATEAEAAPGELGADLVDGDGKARREPFDHDHQGRAVRLPGSQVAAASPGQRTPFRSSPSANQMTRG